MAASATFALKAGVWFRRGRRCMVSPDSLGTACPPSGRNSTYRPVQILEAGSFRFRSDGGVAMVSGDHNILQKPVNLAAYTASGLVSVWPPTGWPELKRWGQAGFLLRWWPRAVQRS